MGFKLPLDMQVSVIIQPQDGAGNPAEVQGAPVWEVGGEAGIVSLEVATDGLSAIIRPGTIVGSCQVSVAADADLGEGVETIVGLLDVDVIGGKAVSLAMNVGQLVPKTVQV